MKDNRRGFIKKGASIAAALSVGGVTSAMASPSTQEANNALRAYAKDGGMKFGLKYPDFNVDKPSPLAPYALQMDTPYAVTSTMRMDGLKQWDPKAIVATKEAWAKQGLKWSVVEGPPSLGEKTKLGLAGKDEEIENFITFMKNLKQYSGIDVICYNWSPVIAWGRTDEAKPGRGGALVTAFDYEDIKNKGLTKYGIVTKEDMWKNLEYFLKAVVPEAEKIGMNLAMHPDDPQVDSLQGISRIMTNVPNYERMMKIVPSKYNNVTMCQGNFSLMGVDIPTLVRKWGKDKISFVHFRNIKDLSGQVPSTKFTEVFHDEGQIDMYEAMKAYYDIGYTGTIRPDHVPTMYGELNSSPGYMTLGNLFAFGYMRGLAESISKAGSKKA
jgi:mannonate dehydratase